MSADESDAIIDGSAASLEPAPELEAQQTPDPQPEPQAEPELQPQPQPQPPPAAGFEVDGEKWIARPAGIGSYGTGITARASVLAIHFFRFDEPASPVREVLTGTGSFESLYDEELRDLFRRSRPIVER